MSFKINLDARNSVSLKICDPYSDLQAQFVVKAQATVIIPFCDQIDRGSIVDDQMRVPTLIFKHSIEFEEPGPGDQHKNISIGDRKEQ